MRLKKSGNYAPSFFKFLATLWMLLINITVAVKNSSDCDSIISLHFCLLFAYYLWAKNRLLKFDEELSACWKKSYGLRLRLPTHWSYFTSKNLMNLEVEAEAIDVEAEAVCKYTAFKSLVGTVLF